MQAHGALAARKRTFVTVLAVIVCAAFAAMLWLRPGPAAANPRTDFVAVAVGSTHTCAVTDSGSVVCWGWTFEGSFRDGTAVVQTVPVAMSGLESDVTDVTASGLYSCALTAAGAVQCWGFNHVGESPTTPEEVAGLDEGALAITSAGNRTCALTNAGAVKCWDEGWRTIPPRVVPGLESGVSDITIGRGHTCVLTATGAVQCLGENRSGQLGDGTNDNRSTPANVVGLASGVAVIAAGTEHSCALTDTGGVLCWGNNMSGQLGDGTDTHRNVPVSVAGLSSGVTAIVAGGLRSCAILEAGGVKCWGSPFGATPVELPGAESGVVDLSLGIAHACLLADDGGIRCWGNNGLGQLGDGTRERRLGPVDVVAVQAKPTPAATPCPAAGCPTPTATPVPVPCPAEACMALVVTDEAGDTICHSSADVGCDLPVGSDLSLAVDAFAVPENGYVLMQSAIQYGDDLIYNKVGSADDEIVWPDAALAQRFDSALGIILHGGLTGLLPPLPVSHYEGIFVEISMSCSADESSTEVRLLPEGDPIVLTSGAAFVGPRGSDVPGLIIVPQVGSLRVACCDERVTSVDALYILQREAALITAIPCGWDGDVDADGDIDSIDAALTLQFVAQLIAALPRAGG
ncbi:MAG: hypothetical protein IH866_00055 [Chloroflexi bacterium]|nr:hypothetical protein [Chloroflexota bacterium]